MKIGFMSGTNTDVYQNAAKKNNTSLNQNQNSIKAPQKKDSVQDGLTERITNIEAQINSLSENNELTPEEKLQKKTDLETQKKDLERQLEQRRLEQQQAEKEKVEEQIKEQVDQVLPKQENENIPTTDPAMEKAIIVTTAMKEMETLNHVKQKLQSEARIANAEASSNASLGMSSEYQNKVLLNVETNLDKISKKIGTVLGDTIKKISKPDEENPKEEIQKKTEQEEKKKLFASNQYSNNYISVDYKI